MPLTSPTQRDATASSLLLIAFVAGIAVNFFTKTSMFDKSFSGALPAWITVGVLALIRLLIYFIRHGKLWAKIVCAVFVGLSLLFSLVSLAALITQKVATPSTAEVVNFILQLVLLLIMTGAIIYSFKKPRCGWEKQMQHELSSGAKPEGELL